MRVTYVKATAAYLCDPKKNEECRKTNCFENDGACYMTTHPENALDGCGIFRYFPQMRTVEESI